METSSPAHNDTLTQSPSRLASPSESPEPRYGGFTRFEIELEFVQSLASPEYINWLASQKYFEKPAFVAYLSYLQYFTKPPYLKFLTWPGPTLRNLELLQQESFRSAILGPDVAGRLREEGIKAAYEWHEEK